MTVTEKNSECAAQSMEFVPQKRPALKAGDYEVAISHEIKVSNETKQLITRGKKFSVRGERFHLDEADVHFCYPPMGGKGDFAVVLPHIVLKNAALPWQRTACGKDNKTPWLALLLFTAEECKSIVEGREKIGDLHRLQGWLESGESPDDQCMTIEVPDSILKNIIPSAPDMDWLCHGRKVTGEAKEDSDDIGTQEYAVIIGNRLPQIDQKEEIVNRVYLVSLEGYHDAARDSWYSPVDGKVQLISLKRWEFTCTEDHYSFSTEVKKLNGGVIGSSREVQDTLLKKMLAEGYTLLPHQMRQGDKSVSLYRGPLVPLIVPDALKLPFTCGDEALRLYKHLGIFDVSYAAAWQLGRLLALQNNSFTILLCKWKREMRQTKLIQKDKEETEKLFGHITRQEDGEMETAEKKDDFAGVGSWLGELKRLTGIPFHYLVPEPLMMLPENSIRFFNVDLNWTNSLVDGALSLGRSTTADLARDEEYVSIMHLEADHAARCSRQKEKLSRDGEKIELMSGVLIRSEIIVNWPGIEIEAFSGKEKATENALAIVSMRRLADTVLMCLFEGNIARLDIHPPAESLHYCFEKKSENLILRNPQNGVSAWTPDFDTNQLFRQADLNVLDVAGLAEKIKKQFKLDDPQFTSAQFGLSLIAPGNYVTFLKAGL